MEKTVVAIVASILIGLGAWNLNQTFNLSIEVATMQTQIDSIVQIQKQMKNQLKKKNNTNNNKKKKKKKNNG